ncbi:MAG: substrate-binding domain-containing protein [Pseudomonadota bacterium]
MMVAHVLNDRAVGVSNYDAVRRHSCDPLPTAIISGNDGLAIDALLECAERNPSVPDDNSIAGFDTLAFAMNASAP